MPPPRGIHIPRSPPARTRRPPHSRASENSVESIKMVEAFGASVVEIDVRVTKDGVPVLFHDDNLGPRLNEGPFCHGPVVDFTLVTLRAACKLKFGE